MGHTSPFLIEDESYADTSRWTEYYGKLIAHCIVQEEIWRWKTQIMAHITSYLTTIFEALQRATVERLRMDEANEGTNFHNDYSVRYVPLIAICAEQIIAHYKEYMKPKPALAPVVGSDHQDSDNDNDDRPHDKRDKRPQSW